MYKNFELTILTEEQVWGSENTTPLKVLEEYGTESTITDLAIITGADFKNNENRFDYESTKKRGHTWTMTKYGLNEARVIDHRGNKNTKYVKLGSGVIRPVLILSPEMNIAIQEKQEQKNGTVEVEFGEYPQDVVDQQIDYLLEYEYQQNNLKTSGKTYTFNARKWDDFDEPFLPIKYEEYKYKGKKYIRVKANAALNSNKHYEPFSLSNKKNYRNEDHIWIEVKPITWLYDKQEKLLISQKGLLAGIRFNSEKYNGDFSKTELKEYMDTYMKKDIVSNLTMNQTKTTKSSPYNFDFEQISEEEIIRGCIESDIPVFLHGPSSEGKSARIKQIDPDCTILYLRNISLEGLNGKCIVVENKETNRAYGEGQTAFEQSINENTKMVYIKPTWLVKLEEKCQKEPNKIHILFLDEISNAVPGIQGMAFNIVLDKEVNGIWKLPKNARIAAAGNDIEDSLSAHQLSEPLFNRFAHVYIKTTYEKWLEWAKQNHIHPAIYTFMVFKRGEVLRSEYDGIKPNADPRKWEMASKMLYATGKPEMLRALIGEEITREFIAFCSQKVIILEDVMNGNYTDADLITMNNAEKYATINGLARATEEEYEIVRTFIANLEPEYGNIFDAIWAQGKEERLELIAEFKLKNHKQKIIVM